MSGARKVTVELPADLLRRAQKSTGDGITSTIRRGLELVAAGEAYRGLITRDLNFHTFAETADLKILAAP